MSQTNNNAEKVEKEVCTERMIDVQNGTLSLMNVRQLSQHETNYFIKRDQIYNIRRLVEKLLFMLPSIIHALASWL